MTARPCAIEGCGKQIRARNWCAMHYQRWWVHGDPLKASKPGMRSRGRKCSIEDCDRAHKGHGLCAMHMQRLRAHGSPLQSQRYEYFTTREKARCHIVLDRDPDGLAYARRGEGQQLAHVLGRESQSVKDYLCAERKRRRAKNLDGTEEKG